jgi:transposase InsO family protein
MNDEKKRHDIAVFRFGLIAPAANKTHAGTQAEYFRRLTQTELDVPHAGLVRYKPETLRRWLSDYRTGGFAALIPKPRSDVGQHRVITPEIEARIRELLAEHPRITAGKVRERLVDEGTIASRSPSESVIRRFIRSRGLRVAEPLPSGRHAFAKTDPNQLWTLDFMHGPRLSGLRSRPRLLAIIDDASRFIVFASFLPSESYADLAPGLVDAVVRHGLPLAIYCDNGAAFSTRDLALACARLDVALIHSRPYTPQGRGKIERFFLTVRKRFLDALDSEHLRSLDALNAAFASWLDSDYHRRLHSGIGATPLSRFLDSKRPKRWVSRQEIDLHFHCTLTRKVRSDCTVSVNGVRYEVPAQWIGRKVELRHPVDDPTALTLFAQGQPAAAIKPLDLEHNDRLNRRASFATPHRSKE